MINYVCILFIINYKNIIYMLIIKYGMSVKVFLQTF